MIAARVRSDQSPDGYSAEGYDLGGARMSDQTAIEWTDATWNPVTGCTKVSPGCKNCYAERLAFRLRAMGNPRYGNGFALTLQPDQLTLPLRWRQPRRIFVNSMSDLFHEAVPEAGGTHATIGRPDPRWSDVGRDPG